MWFGPYIGPYIGPYTGPYIGPYISSYISPYIGQLGTHPLCTLLQGSLRQTRSSLLLSISSELFDLSLHMLHLCCLALGLGFV